MSSRLRILVIDDDPMFRSVIVSLLRKNYIISVASDGESGFDKAQLHRPDLVIIDYQMPGWDGLQTLKAFRNDLRFQAVKTMMLTSDASKEVVLAAIQAGADSYIIKTTFNKNDFLAKVEQHLSPTIVRAVNVKATATVQPAAKAFDPNQKPAIQISAPASNMNPAPRSASSNAVANKNATVEVKAALQADTQAKEFPSSTATIEKPLENSARDEQYDLEKEMEEFQKTLLTQKKTDELIEAAAAPIQEGPSEQELLEDVMDDWE